VESKPAKRNKQRRQNKKNILEVPSNSNTLNEEAAPVHSPPTPEDITKKAKAIEKKLRQIASLKEKQNDGVILNEDQLQKIAAEADLTKQLNSLKM